MHGRGDSLFHLVGVLPVKGVKKCREYRELPSYHRCHQRGAQLVLDQQAGRGQRGRRQPPFRGCPGQNQKYIFYVAFLESSKQLL